MRIIQFINKERERRVGIVQSNIIISLDHVYSTYELFFFAEKNNLDIKDAVSMLATSDCEDYEIIIAENRVLVPLDHPDPYHTWITGTGLTHLGSAKSRHEMHTQAMANSESQQTDSIKIYQEGVMNGKFKDSKPGVQPEWFYKGNGLTAVASGNPLSLPSFALDGGEEPEIAGLYIINSKGKPCRIGFSLANEFSDHKMEKMNYLYLAHSKLRQCSFGPELLLDDLPGNIKGTTQIIRNKKVIWEKEFLTGEDNMSHNIANLEYHNFKYDLFRQPKDVHVHFFGTSVLSFTDGINVLGGDVFKIEAEHMGRPLINTLHEEVN